MKGELTLAILKLVQASVMTTAQLLDALTYYGRDAHYRRLRGGSTPLPERKPILEGAIAKRERRIRLSKLISKLRVEGFIANDSEGNSGTIRPTAKGTEKISALEKASDKSLKLERIAHSAASREVKIIVFDIPEEKRVLRDALRSMLKLMKFSMLQKSAWVGNVVVPKEFFEWLDEHDLLSCVEILSVTKEGTLKQLR